MASRSPLDPAGFDALLFDLGGVLLRIDWQRAFDAWAANAGCAPETIARRFRPCAAFAAHERGEIDAPAYFAALRVRLGIAIADADMLAGWNSIFAGEMPGARELLAAARDCRPLFLFSNTGAAHRDHWQPRYAALLEPIAVRFLSCEIGMRKPERRAFAHVAGAIGAPPGRIAFFDDLPENVAGARAAGLRAFQVRSPAQIAAALRLSA